MMKLHIILYCFVALTLTPELGAAQTSWTSKSGEAKVCSAETQEGCVTLTCAPGGRIALTVNGGGVLTGKGDIVVDGQLVARGRFGGSRGFAQVQLDPQAHASILSALKRGTWMQARVPGRTVNVSLAGSSKAIEALVPTCLRTPAASTVTRGSDTFSVTYKRRRDEATVTVDDIEVPLTHFTRTTNADISGGDLRNGLSDPLLKDISEKACARLCIATEGCGAYTWNGKNGKVCFLKTGGGRMSRYEGATSATLNSAHEIHLPPPTKGPLPVIDERAAWRPGDTNESFSARIRPLGASMARNCAVERAELADLARDIQLYIPGDGLQVGESLVVRWAGNTLATRIPVWVVASTPDMSRTEGSGSMTLGPEAPNPFGLAHGIGQTRAFVSLWSRGAPASGHIALRPLEAGQFQVNLSLVAYLRQCSEEVVLIERREEVNVDPAPAELVVGTALSQADLTHAQDSPLFDRRVAAGESRFRVTALSDGTEVIERAGQHARLSPTGRFVTVWHGGALDVIDLIDGATVGTLRSIDDQVTWGVGDSIVFGSTAPWAVVDLVFPFGARKLIDHQITGPSCCSAGPSNTHLAVDLENGLVTLRGPLGHAIAPVQGAVFAREAAGNGYASNSSWSAAMQAIALRSIGLVSPISVNTGYSIPGGSASLGLRVVDLGQPISRDKLLEDVQVTSMLRGAGGARTGAVGAFERIGIFLSESIGARHLLPPVGTTREHVGARSEDVLTSLKSEVQRIGGTAGWVFDFLPTPSGNYQAADCFSFLGPEAEDAEFTGQNTFARPGHLALPDDIDQLDAIETRDGYVLVGRIGCVGGATGGTLRGGSKLFVTEVIRGQQPATLMDAAMLSYGYMASDVEPQFQDDPFEAKLYGRQLLLHTPGAGGIAVIDLDRQEVVRVFTNLPSGDLLSDAFLSEDSKHVLQMNRDGSFLVWRIGDGNLVLSGRIVEDEIAVWTPDFRFEATSEAASLIDLKFPGLDGQFSLDRFDPVLQVPGLVAQVMGGAQLPIVAVDVPPDLSGSIGVDGNMINVSATLAIDRAAQQLKLYQDGVLTDSLDLAPGQVKATLTVKRLAGARHAAVVALSAEGLASAPLTMDLGPSTLNGQHRALLVAVDRYTDPELQDLNLAKADAYRLIRTLSNLPESAPMFEEPRFVGGRHAKPPDVLNAVENLVAGLGADGHAVLFFAGHGLRGTDGEYYLAMHNTDLDDLPGTALRFDDIAARLERTVARVTILIDACHSGDAGIGHFATNDGATAGLAQLPANVTILAASKGRQSSIEATALKGGLFTVALERVLLAERARFDIDGNGRIEASELSSGVKRIVSAQSDGWQVPWMTKGRIVGDYALF